LRQSVQGFKFYKTSKFQFFRQEIDVAIITVLHYCTACDTWYCSTINYSM